MIQATKNPFLLSFIITCGVPSVLMAQEEAATDTSTGSQVDTTTILDAMQDASEDVLTFNEHVVVLSSPYMGGRLPGTPGMERAKDYMQHYFEDYGLVGAVQLESGERSFRQPFPLGSKEVMVDQAFSVEHDGETMEFVLGSDYEFTGLGTGGSFEGTPVFVGYCIQNEQEEYFSFDENDDLSGKVAIMLRFEPMDEDGASLWNDQGWTRRATFRNKFRTLMEHEPSAVILVNPPGANDNRINMLIKEGQRTTDVPVFMLSMDACDRMLKQIDDQGRGLMDFRMAADQAGGITEFPDATVRLNGQIQEEQIYAENVIGLLPGRGTLKDEYIVIGGHLDHLGMGEFGSRSQPGKLHPGADDNATGSIAVIMLAEDLASDYAEMDEDADLRSIMFVGFTAEESGLNGSAFYVDNPVVEMDKHALMINFDMIGRSEDKFLELGGLSTGEGMREWAMPMIDKSDLDVNTQSGGGGSDHSSFMRKGVPVMFGHTGIHQDYHTPEDTADKINRETAVQVIDLFHELALASAQRPERFVYEGGGGGRGRFRMPNVRFGVRSKIADDGTGLEIVEIVPDGSADEAGLLVGDQILTWNKIELETRLDLLNALRDQDPGDEVQVKIRRDGEEQVVFVTLQGR